MNQDMKKHNLAINQIRLFLDETRETLETEKCNLCKAEARVQAIEEQFHKLQSRFVEIHFLIDQESKLENKNECDLAKLCEQNNQW